MTSTVNCELFFARVTNVWLNKGSVHTHLSMLMGSSGRASDRLHGSRTSLSAGNDPRLEGEGGGRCNSDVQTELRTDIPVLRGSDLNEWMELSALRNHEMIASFKLSEQAWRGIFRVWNVCTHHRFQTRLGSNQSTIEHRWTSTGDCGQSKHHKVTWRSAIGALKFCKPGFRVFDKVYRLLEFSSLKLKVLVTCLGIKLGDGKDIWKGEAEERFRDAPSTMVWRALSADKRHQCKDHQLHQYRRHHHLHLHYHPSSFTITIMTSHPPYQHRLHHRHHRRRQHQHDTTT